MEDTFLLRIALGNDAMQSGEDVAGALRALADVVGGHGFGPLDTCAYGVVRDLNGNTVGAWEVQ